MHRTFRVLIGSGEGRQGVWTSRHEAISRNFSNTLVETSARWIIANQGGDLCCRPQMLSDDILSVWVGGS